MSITLDCAMVETYSYSSLESFETCSNSSVNVASGFHSMLQSDKSPLREISKSSVQDLSFFCHFVLCCCKFLLNSPSYIISKYSLSRLISSVCEIAFLIAVNCLINFRGVTVA